MLINLTPHDIHIYPPDTPDRIDPVRWPILLTIEPSSRHKAVRLESQQVGGNEAVAHAGVMVPVIRIEHCTTAKLPPPRQNVQYIVSLIVAMDAPASRDDLLVPHAHIRDSRGRVVGTRGLARPVRVKHEPTGKEAPGDLSR